MIAVTTVRFNFPFLLLLEETQVYNHGLVSSGYHPFARLCYYKTVIKFLVVR